MQDGECFGAGHGEANNRQIYGSVSTSGRCLGMIMRHGWQKRAICSKDESMCRIEGNSGGRCAGHLGCE